MNGIKNIIQRQNFENIVRQMRTIESRLVLFEDKLMKKNGQKGDGKIPGYHDNSNISKTDLLVEVAQLRAKVNKCTCSRLVNTSQTRFSTADKNMPKLPKLQPGIKPIGQSIIIGQNSSKSPPKITPLALNGLSLNLNNAGVQVLNSNTVSTLGGNAVKIATNVKKTVRPMPSAGPPPAKFAKVLIRDDKGQGKTVLIPAEKLQTVQKSLNTRNNAQA